MFTGLPGKTYAFYSVARDQTANLEDTPSVADTTTRVNALPIANAGSDQTVNEGDLVTLSGSGSDPDGDPMSFSWTQTRGPSVTLVNPNTATPSFRAPFVNSATTLTFQVTVSDGLASSTDTVVVAVQDPGASIHGTVMGSGPVAGAQVTLKKGRKTVGTAVTDAAGFYAFPGLDPAEYTVKVKASGFQRQSKKVTLAAGEDKVLDFTLKPRRRGSESSLLEPEDEEEP